MIKTPVRKSIRLLKVSSLRYPTSAFITQVQMLDIPGGANILLDKVIVATEYEDGFFTDRLCYSNHEGNTFIVENSEIKKLFEDYARRFY